MDVWVGRNNRISAWWSFRALLLGPSDVCTSDPCDQREYDQLTNYGVSSRFIPTSCALVLMTIFDKKVWPLRKTLMWLPHRRRWANGSFI